MLFISISFYYLFFIFLTIIESGCVLFKFLVFQSDSSLVYSPIGRFLVQETFPKTLPRFVLILTERQRNQAFCVTAADWSHDHDLMNINPTHAHADKLDM